MHVYQTGRCLIRRLLLYVLRNFLVRKSAKPFTIYSVFQLINILSTNEQKMARATSDDLIPNEIINFIYQIRILAANFFLDFTTNFVDTYKSWNNNIVYHRCTKRGAKLIQIIIGHMQKVVP